MEQIPSWKAKRFTASHEILRILWKPEGSLPHTQEPIVCRYPMPDQNPPQLISLASRLLSSISI
jgi:hypothetical protein